jgi:chromosome segregation ATPase
VQLAEVVTQAIASKTQITDLQTVIATKSAHIEEAQIHADKVRADLDRALTAATQNTTEAEGLKSRAEAAALSASELLAEIKASKLVVDGHGGAVTELLKEINKATESTKEIAAKALTTDRRIETYEKQLKSLTEQYETQRQTIIGLLPGATSAGLASAFDKRRQTFLKPRLVWQWAFIVSVSLLVLICSPS